MNLMKFPEMHMDGSCIDLSDRPIAVEYGDISTRCIGLSSFFRFHRVDDVRAGIQVRAVQYFCSPPPRRGRLAIGGGPSERRELFGEARRGSSVAVPQWGWETDDA